MMLWWPGAQTTVSPKHCDTSFDEHSDNGADQNCIAINTTSNFSNLSDINMYIYFHNKIVFKIKKNQLVCNLYF